MFHSQICQVTNQLFCFFIALAKRDFSLNISDIYHKALIVSIQNPYIPVQRILPFILLYMDQFCIPHPDSQLMVHIGVQRQAIKGKRSKTGIRRPGRTALNVFRSSVYADAFCMYRFLRIQLF